MSQLHTMTDLSKINGNRLGGALWALHAEATRPNHRTMVLAVIGAMIVEGLIVLGVSHVHVVPPPAPRTMRVTMPPPPPPVVKKLEPAPTPVTPKPPSKTPPARPAPALKPAVIPAARHPAVHAPPWPPLRPMPRRRRQPLRRHRPRHRPLWRYRRRRRHRPPCMAWSTGAVTVSPLNRRFPRLRCSAASRRTLPHI